MLSKKIKPNHIDKGLALYDPLNPMGEDDSIFPFTIEKHTEPAINYRIIPDYAIENNNNDVIAHAIASMYEPPKDRINFTNLSYLRPKSVFFNLLFKPKFAGFYLSTPQEYKELLEGKMKTVWNKSEIRKTNATELLDFEFNNTEVCELVLKDYNFKSLNTNRGNLYPLTNMMSVLRQLQEDEQVRICIMVEPIKRSNWVTTVKDEIKAYNKGVAVDNEMSRKEKAIKLGFIGAEAMINLFIEYRLLMLESILGIITPEKEEEKNIIEVKIDSLESIKTENKVNRLSAGSNYKMTAETFKTRIVILSQSKDKNRAKLNMLSVANSYKDINGDNELVPKLLSKGEQYRLFNQIMYGGLEANKKCILSDKEVAKLIQLPQKDLQQEYGIDRIDTREVEIPKELMGGKVRIGIAEKQGRKITTTWSTNKNVMALAKVFVGAQNSGKTTAVIRTVKDCYMANYSNFTIDYVESCELAREIASAIPEEDKVIIKLGEKNFIQSLAYNEVTKLITENMDSWERVRLANLIAEQVEYLINAVTDSSTGELTAPMIRYLHAASMITFIKPGAKIDDVFSILRRWDKRNEAIRYAKYSGCFDKDDDIFFDLEELHKRDKDGKVIGTREDLIVGVLNRVTILQKNPYLKAMLKADIDLEQDFTKYIEQGKSVFIMIPQYIFPNPMIRDILATFFISRIWLTVQMRQNNKDARLCNVIFDEVHQVPTTAKFLSNHITEFRRHRLGLLLSCHYLKQMRELLIALKSSGASYVLIAGTEKENLEMLKEGLFGLLSRI